MHFISIGYHTFPSENLKINWFLIADWKKPFQCSEGHRMVHQRPEHGCTCITCNHLLWPLFPIVECSVAFKRCLKPFCFSRKVGRWDLELMPSTFPCLLCLDNSWCPKDFAWPSCQVLLAEHSRAFVSLWGVQPCKAPGWCGIRSKRSGHSPEVVSHKGKCLQCNAAWRQQLQSWSPWTHQSYSSAVGSGAGNAGNSWPRTRDAGINQATAAERTEEDTDFAKQWCHSASTFLHSQNQTCSGPCQCRAALSREQPGWGNNFNKNATTKAYKAVSKLCWVTLKGSGKQAMGPRLFLRLCDEWKRGLLTGVITGLLCNSDNIHGLRLMSIVKM